MSWYSTRYLMSASSQTPRLFHGLFCAAILCGTLIGLGRAEATNQPTVVRVQGNMGEFDIQLLDFGTPKTVANFLGYVQRGDYSNSIIHRSVPGFVVQGGGFLLRSNQVADVPTRPAVTNEAFFSNVRGTVAMAKLGGNPHSATSQWFINLSDRNAASLDVDNGGYAVFGVVVGNGMAVADAIATLQVYDASQLLGGVFGELPLRGNSLSASNFVQFRNFRRMNTDTRVLRYDFSAKDEGFVAGFADLPAKHDAARFALRSSRTNLPPNLGGTNGAKGLFISGANASSDLWMFWKRKVAGLRPGTVYEATFDLELASAAAAGSVGIGGSPGTNVFLKAGASPVEPRAIADKQGTLRLNVDKGNQAQGGAAASVLGNIAKPAADKGTGYSLLFRDNRTSRLRVKSAGDGSLWLYFGSDSGFAGTTALYYTKLTAVLEPVGKNQKIAFTKPADQTFQLNKTFTLSATATSKLNVAFTSSDPKILSITGRTAKILGKGPVTITASQNGDMTWNQATPVPKPLTIK